MSLGWGATDIVNGIKTCKWIWDNCFDKNNVADVRYREFRQDFQGLSEKLLELEQTLDKAIYELGSLNPNIRNLCQQFRSLMGDFNSTLERCEEILSKHVELKKDRAGFIKNVVWGITVQQEVDELRTRIQFHTQKIDLVIAPLEIELLRNIHEGVSEMRQSILPPQELTLECIPAWLDGQFRSNLDLNPPKTCTDIGHIPLEEGFVAIHRHLSESTYQFEGDAQIGDQTIEQYLNLLKSQWMVESLRQEISQKGATFNRTRRGSLYRRTLAQIEQKISEEYQRRDLIRFSDTELKSVNNVAFLIWEPGPVKEFKVVTDPHEGEEEILKLSLSASSVGKEDLIFFRTGPTTLRIVRTVVPSGDALPHHIVERFNSHVDRLIPFYTIGDANAVPRVEIYRGNETGGSVFELQEEKDVLSFQRAMTNYQVVYDDTGVQWAAKRTIKQEAGSGRLQIWHWKPLKPVPAPPGRESSQSTSTASTAADQSSHSQRLTSQQPSALSASVQKVVQGCNSSMVTVLEDSNKNTAAVAFQKPVPPALVFYTRKGKEYTCFYLSMDIGIRVDKSRCDCRMNPGSCRSIVIENQPNGSKKESSKKERKPFEIRRLSAKDSSINDWDLSIFGSPRHPMFDDKSKIERIECQHLKLTFATAEKRKELGDSLEIAFVLFDQAEQEFRKANGRAGMLSGKPNYEGPVMGDSLYQLGSITSSTDRRSYAETRRSSTNPSLLRPISVVSLFPEF